MKRFLAMLIAAATLTFGAWPMLKNPNRLT